MNRTVLQFSVFLFVLLAGSGSSVADLGDSFEFCLRKLHSPREFAEARAHGSALDSFYVLFDLADIESYDAPGHVFILSEQNLKQVQNREINAKHCEPGKFYVRVNEETVYSGRVKSLLSSTILSNPEAGPYVMSPFFSGQNKRKIFIKLNQPVEVDPRNDQRILKVLRESGVLQE